MQFTHPKPLAMLAQLCYAQCLLLLLLAGLVPFLLPDPLSLPSPNTRAPKDNCRSNDDTCGQSIAEQVDAKEERGELADIESYADAECSGLGCENVYTADAGVLCHCVEGQGEDMLRYGECW